MNFRVRLTSSSHHPQRQNKGLTMTDLVLHTVLHGQENYHLFRLKFLIKRLAEMKSRGTEYFKINIECILYIYCIRSVTYVSKHVSQVKKKFQVSHG